MCDLIFFFFFSFFLVTPCLVVAGQPCVINIYIYIYIYSAKPLQGDSLLFTKNPAGVPGTHCIGLRKMKGWLELETFELPIGFERGTPSLEIQLGHCSMNMYIFYIHGITHGRFLPICPPIQIFPPLQHFKKKTVPPNPMLRINCVQAFVWEKTYFWERSNSSGGGNVFLIKIKIKWQAGQNFFQIS